MPPVAPTSVIAFTLLPLRSSVSVACGWTLLTSKNGAVSLVAFEPGGPVVEFGSSAGTDGAGGATVMYVTEMSPPIELGLPAMSTCWIR